VRISAISLYELQCLQPIVLQAALGIKTRTRFHIVTVLSADASLAAAAAAAGVETGSGKPKTEKCGKVTRAQVEVRAGCGRG
jgi:ribosomal protein L11